KGEPRKLYSFHLCRRCSRKRAQNNTPLFTDPCKPSTYPHALGVRILNNPPSGKSWPSRNETPVVCWRPMISNRGTRVGLAVLGLMALLLTGCPQDPQVRKQQHFERGSRYLSDGKYNEATTRLKNP